MFLFSLSSVQEWHDSFYNMAVYYSTFNSCASTHFLLLHIFMKEINITLQSAITSSMECVAALEYFQERIIELQANRIMTSSLNEAIIEQLKDIKISLYQLSHNFLVYTYPTLTSKYDHLYGLRHRVHYAIEVFQEKYPDKKQEEYWEKEYELRHLMKGRIYPQYPPNLTKGWPERVIPYVYSTTWPIRSKHVLIPIIIELYRHDLVKQNTEHPPIFPLNIWWRAEDAHACDPIGTWALVWREWDCDQIHEGWIQRIASSVHDSIPSWQHWQTCYFANMKSPLPLLSASEK